MSELKDVKIVTISWDADQGLEVEFDGCSPYEAWAFLWHATELLAQEIDPVQVGDD